MPTVLCEYLGVYTPYYGHVTTTSLNLLFSLYEHLYTYHPQQADGQQAMPMPPLQVMKPNELFYSKIIPLLKENGLSEQTPRKEWPHHIQLRVLKELIAETPANLLARYISHTIKATYCISYARPVVP